MSGTKRHLLVDTSGLVLNAVVHPAEVPDRDGARLVPEPGEEDELPRRACPAQAPVGGGGLARGGFAGVDNGAVGPLLGDRAECRPRWVWVPKDVEPENPSRKVSLGD